jgi:biopolymer transport protein ExbD
MDPERWDDGLDVLDGENVELNLTSLVDVVFALLIVFMVSSAAMVEQGRADAPGDQIELSLPAGRSAATEAPPGELVLALDADGSLYQDGQATDAKAVAKLVTEKLAGNPQLQVRVEADEKLTYQRVMELIGDLQQLGVRNVGLATRRPTP